MKIQIYSENLQFTIKNNIENFLNNKNKFDVTFNNWNCVNSNYLTDLVFPENNLSSLNSSLNSFPVLKVPNIWEKLSSRPFKICPITKEKLYQVSNNSVLVICVFNESNGLDGLVGFVVVSDRIDYYWIEIFCTNINQGIGSLIDNLIKLILISKPIRLQSTFNSKEFYIKKGFVVLNEYLLEYSITQNHKVI
jgi:hypothetical protein